MAGSATRSPLITSAIEGHFGKVPQRTLNSEEAVSKGCALMGAMLSPSFKVSALDDEMCRCMRGMGVQEGLH